MKSKDYFISRLKIAPADAVKDKLELQCEETFVTVTFKNNKTTSMGIELGLNAI